MILSKKPVAVNEFIFCGGVKPKPNPADYSRAPVRTALLTPNRVFAVGLKIGFKNKDMVDLIHSNESSADKEFNKVLRKTVGFSVKNAFRSLGKGYLPFLRGSESALPEVRKYEKRVNSISAKLAPPTLDDVSKKNNSPVALD